MIQIGDAGPGPGSCAEWKGLESLGNSKRRRWDSASLAPNASCAAVSQ
jgi:hypothetical protein